MLAADAQPALYVLEQDFEAEGARARRCGLLARFRAEDPSAARSCPTSTRARAPREDRYRVLKATRANFSPIFLMFPRRPGALRGAAGGAARRPADLAYTDDGGVRASALARHATPAAVAGLQERARRARKAYIADGHHRYATALRYRDEYGPAGRLDARLLHAARRPGPGRAALPPHPRRRPVARRGARARCERQFRLNDVAARPTAARAAAQSTMPYAFGLAEPGGGALVAEALPEAEDAAAARTRPPSLRALDTYFLHQAVLPPLLSVPRRRRELRALPGARRRRRWRRRRCRLAVLHAAHARAPDRGRGRGPRVDAGQEHVLPSQAAVRPGHPSAAG